MYVFVYLCILKFGSVVIPYNYSDHLVVVVGLLSHLSVRHVCCVLPPQALEWLFHCLWNGLSSRDEGGLVLNERPLYFVAFTFILAHEMRSLKR